MKNKLKGLTTMKKPLLLLVLSSILFSTATIAEYKINITSPVLNQNTTFGEVVTSAPELIPFDETGDSGNISLVGSNGITASSITSNGIASSSDYRIEGLFDGYQASSLINSSSAGKIMSGGFHTPSGSNSDVWFLVDLGRTASISGFSMMSFRNNFSGYNPKDIIIESSVDGVSFTEEESFTLPEVIDTGVISMFTPFNSRYFRFYVVNSYSLSFNNSEYIAFGEIEIFQTQP
jgi:hypothetical protein